MKDLKEYARKVQEMRSAQDSFTKAARRGLKKEQDLAYERSLELQRDVDRITLEILAQSDNQQSMF